MIAEDDLAGATPLNASGASDTRWKRSLQISWADHKSLVAGLLRALGIATRPPGCQGTVCETGEGSTLQGDSVSPCVIDRWE